jgi:hypothetical protein
LILGASPGQIVWIVWLNVGIITFQCFQVCLSVCVPQVCNWVCWIGWNKAYQISCFDLYGSTQDASIPEPGSIATNECNRKRAIYCSMQIYSRATCVTHWWAHSVEYQWSTGIFTCEEYAMLDSSMLSTSWCECLCW